MEKRLGILAFTLSAILISTFILSSISFVSAITMGEQILSKIGPLGNIFEGITLDEDGKIILAKWMLVFLLTIVVYAISTALPFFPKDKSWLKWVFAIIIAVLGFLFITPTEIRLLLTNYAALGIALTTIIPLVIIITFTYELRKEKPDVATFVNKPVLILFFLYLIVSWLNFEPDNYKSMSSGLHWLYLITMAATLIWLLFEKKIIQKAIKNYSDWQMERAEDKIKKSARLKKLEAEEMENLAAGRSTKDEF